MHTPENTKRSRPYTFNVPPNAPNKRGRSRRVVFTLNNYTDDEYSKICGLVEGDENNAESSSKYLDWLVVAKEIGEDGTPHLQGAFSVHLNNAVAWSTMHKWPGLSRAHFDTMRGTFEQQVAYCSKGEQPKQEWLDYKAKGINYGKNVNVQVLGEPPLPGKRNDLDSVLEAIRQGDSLRDVALRGDITDARSLVRYHRGLTFYRDLLAPGRDPTLPPIVLWFWGPTGTGKSRVATELGTANGGYWLSRGGGDLKWFDGYEGQPFAILDDFRSKKCSFAQLLRILDRYPIQLEVKGSHTNWNPSTIIVTCPYTPERCFEERLKYRPEDIRQLTRRLVAVLEFGPRALGYKSAMDLFSGNHRFTDDVKEAIEVIQPEVFCMYHVDKLIYKSQSCIRR